MYKTFNKKNQPVKIADAQKINVMVDKKVKNKPADDHPWRNYSTKFTQQRAAQYLTKRTFLLCLDTFFMKYCGY